MEPQVIGRATDVELEELEGLQNLATPELPWPHDRPSNELPDDLVQAVFDSLAAEAEAERRRVEDLQARAGDTPAKRNRRETYLGTAQRREWEGRARSFLERRSDVVRALSTEALYSAVMMQHLLDLDAADTGLPAAQRRSDDAYTGSVNGQFVLDAARGRYTVEGEVFHFAEAEGDEPEEAFVERVTEAVRRLALKQCGEWQLERVTTAMSQSGVAALERSGLCRTAVSGGSLQVEYRLDEDLERKEGLVVRLQTRRQGFREYLPGGGGEGVEDATPLPCDATSSLQKTATVAYGPKGDVDVLDFCEDIDIRRNGERLEPELFCTAIPWRPAELAGTVQEGTARRRWSLLDCVQQLCSCCRPRQRGQAWANGVGPAAGGSRGHDSGATLEL
mmetsp:Transcript_29498/g.81002  ORF Transcript_29498/g.81002 Transcript_29498/m.81002 type:complete len:392 (-) Transcript_29498:112-1287(-)